jgi:hypothetical protein
MIDQLLARAETDLEIATRRRDLALALAADWSYWAPLLGGAAGREPPAQAPGTARGPRARPSRPRGGAIGMQAVRRAVRAARQRPAPGVLQPRVPH